MSKIIYKVKITEEAEFDYEDAFGEDAPIPKYDLKAEVEEYIRNQKLSGRLWYDYYVRVRYYDETHDEMLLVFLYMGRKNACMQEYDLCGLCRESEWSQELEDDGAIRSWLLTKFDTIEKTDWVWDYRIWLKEQEKAQNENYGEDYKTMVKELLKNYKLNKMRVSVGDKADPAIAELDDKVDFLDKCVASMDEDAQDVINAVYIEGLSLNRAGKRFGYSKPGMQKKVNRLIAILEMLFSERYEI